MYVYRIGEFSLNPTSDVLKRDRQQYDLRATCVFAQQYSSATFVPLCLNSRKERYGWRFKNVTVSICSVLKLQKF